MTFTERCIQDNKLTPDGERASALVYEKYTGKCWHILNRVPFGGIIESMIPQDEYFMQYDEGYTHPRIMTYCAKCNAEIRYRDDITYGPDNPPLAFSLDAWREHIFSNMLFSKRRAFAEELEKMNIQILVDNFVVLMNPMRFLEAALRAAGLYDQWNKEAGNGIR